MRGKSTAKLGRARPGNGQKGNSMSRFVKRASKLVVWSGAILTTALMVITADASGGGNHKRGVPRDESFGRSHLTAWVELGPNGKAIARAITTELECPFIKVDHRRHRMSLR